MPRTSHLTAARILILSVLTTAGCSMLGSAQPSRQSAAANPPAATQPATASKSNVAAAQARTERLAQALERAQARAERNGRRIHWNHTAAATQPVATQPASAKPAHPQPATRSTHTRPKPAVVTRAQLVDQLIRLIAASDQSPQSKAVMDMGLSLTQPGWQMDQRLLAGLSFRQRQQVEKLHGLLVLFARRLDRGNANLTRDAIVRQLDKLFDAQPITIQRLELCRQVNGYGVYDPFKYHRFLAGQDQKIIVYVELRHFHPVKDAQGMYQVRLKQQIMLFNRADGLVVWRHKPVQVVDTSRNRRHDFFVVQLIDLPANLSVGEYRLKVRVTDEQGGSLDERTTDLDIVADKDLLDQSDHNPSDHHPSDSGQSD